MIEISQHSAMAPAGRRETELSVVVPCHNEELNINALHGELTKYIAQCVENYELIFVDDGSTDRTAQVLRDLQTRDPKVRLLRLVRNFGHQSALLAGLTAAKGRCVICMDADLQHPPRLIPQMLEAWRTQAPVVQMVRLEHGHSSWQKKLFSGAFYRIINRLSDVPIQPNASDFCLLDRKVVEMILNCAGSRPFIRGLISWLAYPTTTIEYIPDSRFAGEPNYTLRRSLKLAISALISNSCSPLHLGVQLGLIVSVIAVLYAVLAFYAYLSGIAVPGWTSIIGVVLVLGAVQLLIIGVMAQYIGAIFDLTRKLPNYVVIEEQNHAPEKGPVER